MDQETNPKFRFAKPASDAPDASAIADEAHKAEMEIAGLEQLLQKYPDAAMEVSGFITQARQALASGQRVPAEAMTRIHQTLSDLEMKQVQQAVVGGALGMGALAELGHLSHLGGAVGAMGATLLKNHRDFDPEHPNKLNVQSSDYVHHFNPGVIQPGINVTIMPAIDKGRGSRSLQDAGK